MWSLTVEREYPVVEIPSAGLLQPGQLRSGFNTLATSPLFLASFWLLFWTCNFWQAPKPAFSSWHQFCCFSTKIISFSRGWTTTTATFQLLLPRPSFYLYLQATNFYLDICFHGFPCWRIFCSCWRHFPDTTSSTCFSQASRIKRYICGWLSLLWTFFQRCFPTFSPSKYLVWLDCFLVHFNSLLKLKSSELAEKSFNKSASISALLNYTNMRQVCLRFLCFLKHKRSVECWQQ